MFLHYLQRIIFFLDDREQFGNNSAPVTCFHAVDDSSIHWLNFAGGMGRQEQQLNVGQLDVLRVARSIVHNEKHLPSLFLHASIEFLEVFLENITVHPSLLGGLVSHWQSTHLDLVLSTEAPWILCTSNDHGFELVGPVSISRQQECQSLL